ncbi:DUF1801 domain-containing protein [Pontibacter sp. E15-1]|uniref:DUF1801 domain-containing protein n=1 Tax=Pontibacter sp. E15-1 TaxID=2919918 RepID=UPI001F4F821E|nr:DUF1801 domain-containing protein [Pontibacter sp. E15-1]MCJ8166641.1 DUF1801 domain-containing protein [Pontibacter sp. E15-1]
MQSKASTPNQYVAQLPEDRAHAISKLREVIQEHIPDGFVETMSYGMIGYVVPHAVYPNGYHCDPKLPLPFMSIASQKNFIAVYHMGLYADKSLLEWFTEAYTRHCTTKLDMGKSCIRFKKPEAVPYILIGELAGKITAEEWIGMYEAGLKR